MEYVKLNNDVKMPQLGLGTFQSNDAALCEQTILEALWQGYRLIDTAQGYGNEKYIGNALAKTDVPREELFIVTKVWFKNYEDCRQSVLRSMEDLRVDYLDLVLLHWPFGNTYRAWRDLEALYTDPALTAIAQKHGKTSRQVALRYQLQLGIVIIPKTVSPDRLKENIGVFDFELTAGDMQTLSRMDKAQPLIGNPQNPALVEMSAQW